MEMLDDLEEEDDELLDSPSVDLGQMPAVPVTSGLKRNFSADDALEEGRRQTVIPPAGICACFQIAYYQQYFNVDTSDVQDRLRATFTFYKPEPTFLNLIGDTPDLYGPFWIAATLVFCVSVTSNLARSLENGYDYDFELVTNCVSLVYGFLVAWPFIVYLSSKYALNATGPSLLQLACLFGYSLALYLPATILATVSVLAWPALLGACAASSMFLLQSFNPIVEGQREKAAFTGGVVLSELLLTLLLKMQFYKHGF